MTAIRVVGGGSSIASGAGCCRIRVGRSKSGTDVPRLLTRSSTLRSQRLDTVEIPRVGAITSRCSPTALVMSRSRAQYKLIWCSAVGNLS